MPLFHHVMESREKAKQARKRVAQLEDAWTAALASLTERQRRFCEICGGPPSWGMGYRAAAQAGYATPRSEGSRLASMPKVAAALKVGRVLNAARIQLVLAEDDRTWWEAAQRDAVREEARWEAKFDAWVANGFQGERPALFGETGRRRSRRSKSNQPTPSRAKACG